VVSTRAEYNHDVGRTTELELEVTQHHRPKDKFDFKFDEVMYPRQMHSTKAPRYRHSRPTCFPPAQAAAKEADRSRNAFFDGALPPFSNIGNSERGTTPDAHTLHTLRGIGVKTDFSTANPTSAIDTTDGEEPHHQRGPLLGSLLFEAPCEAAAKTKLAEKKATQATQAFDNFDKWRGCGSE